MRQAVHHGARQVKTPIETNHFKTTVAHIFLLQDQRAHQQNRCGRTGHERPRDTGVVPEQEAGDTTCSGKYIISPLAKRDSSDAGQGAYPHCEPMSERAKIRLANEQLFGIKLLPARHEQTTPPGSFTSPDDSSSSQPAGTPLVNARQGLPTPSGTHVISRDKRAQLVLSDVGDGHAEVMFSPTPLKPSSPPRIPLLITPIRTPLSRKIAARSASSPALLAFRTPSMSRTQNGPLDSLDSAATPLQTNSVNLGTMRSLKRQHSFVSAENVQQMKRPQSHKKRQPATKTLSHHDLGRGKENVPPSATLPMRMPLPASTESSDSYGRDIRRIQSENLRQTWHTMPTSSPAQDLDRDASRPSSNEYGQHRTPSRPAPEAPRAPKKMSAEECALSLVSLAHGV